MTVCECIFQIQLHYLKTTQTFTSPLQLELKTFTETTIGTTKTAPIIENTIAAFDQNFTYYAELTYNEQEKKYEDQYICWEIRTWTGKIWNSKKLGKKTINLAEVMNESKYRGKEEYGVEGGARDMFVCFEVGCGFNNRQGEEKELKNHNKTLTNEKQSQKKKTQQIVRKTPQKINRSVRKNTSQKKPLEQSFEKKQTGINLSQYEELASNLEDIKIQLQSQSKQNQQQNNFINVLKQNFEVLQKQNDILTAELSIRQNQNYELQKQIHQYKKSQSEKQKLYFSKINTEAIQLEGEISVLRKKIQELSQQNQRKTLLMTEKDLKEINFHEKIEKADQKMKIAKQDKSRLSKQLKLNKKNYQQLYSKFENQQKHFSHKLKQKQQSNNKVIQKISLAENLIKQLQDKIRILEEQLKSYQIQNVTRFQLNEIMEQYEGKLAKYAEKEQQMKENVEIISLQINQLSDSLLEKQQNQELLMQRVKYLEKDYDDLQGEKEKVEKELEIQIALNENKTIEAQLNNSKVHRSHDQLLNDNKTLSTKNDDLLKILRQNSFAVIQVQKSKSQNTKLLQENEQLRNKYENYIQENKQLKEKINLMIKQSQKLLTRNHKIAKQLQNQHKIVNNLQKQQKQTLKENESLLQQHEIQKKKSQICYKCLVFEEQIIKIKEQTQKKGQLNLKQLKIITEESLNLDNQDSNFGKMFIEIKNVLLQRNSGRANSVIYEAISKNLKNCKNSNKNYILDQVQLISKKLIEIKTQFMKDNKRQNSQLKHSFIDPLQGILEQLIELSQNMVFEDERPSLKSL